MLYRTFTLGCKVNQYETEYLREGLEMAGYREAAPDETADLCIINTCTVTARSDSKSRQIIRRTIRGNPGARVVVMGCYATRSAALLSEIPGVSDVITDKKDLPDFLRRLGVGQPPPGVSGFGQRHRAFIKVQDGCANFCSYCIIPHVRSEPSSRNPEDVLAEVRTLVAGGYREIVLTGIHLGQFGQEPGFASHADEPLVSLLQQLIDIEGQFRIRLSSIEAVEVTDSLLGVMADNPQRVCPHLHLPLQSGSDTVLQRMNRRSGVEHFLATCELVRSRLDNPAITTDVMVGFPGETEEEFSQTCETVQQARFCKMHVFPFSRREGTPAASMPDQLDESVKHQRVQELMQLEGPMRREYFESLLGGRLQVMCEQATGNGLGNYSGTSARYVPVEFPADDDMIGNLVDVHATAATENGITGTL